MSVIPEKAIVVHNAIQTTKMKLHPAKVIYRGPTLFLFQKVV